jgi:hypothetical protein
MILAMQGIRGSSARSSRAIARLHEGSHTCKSFACANGDWAGAPVGLVRGSSPRPSAARREPEWQPVMEVTLHKV